MSGVGQPPRAFRLQTSIAGRLTGERIGVAASGTLSRDHNGGRFANPSNGP
jgi:hypothetical protein